MDSKRCSVVEFAQASSIGFVMPFFSSPNIGFNTMQGEEASCHTALQTYEPLLLVHVHMLPNVAPATEWPCC